MVVLKNSARSERYVNTNFDNEERYEDTYIPELASRHIGIQVITSSELRLLRSSSCKVGTQGFDARWLSGINNKDNVVACWNAFVR